METIITPKQPPIFEFSGNCLCLDFINTVHDRPSGMPLDLLADYSDLLLWGEQTHLVTDKEAKELGDKAVRHPDEAAYVLVKATTLREVMYRIFLAVSQEVAPLSQDIATLNVALAAAMGQLQIVLQADGFVKSWANKEQKLDSVLWPVVHSAADLLTSDKLNRLHVCAASDCNWLFMDTSKNGKRRWCDMKNCGNRTKARNFYKRKKLILTD